MKMHGFSLYLVVAAFLVMLAALARTWIWAKKLQEEGRLLGAILVFFVIVGIALVIGVAIPPGWWIPGGITP